LELGFRKKSCFNKSIEFALQFGPLKHNYGGTLKVYMIGLNGEKEIKLKKNADGNDGRIKSRT